MGIVIGAVAPDFSLPAVGKGIQKGAQISLAAYRGKSKVLLAFYPADFSPVCTSEMRCFREDWEAFRAAGCEILGISSDPLSRHQAFAEQLKLEFPLLKRCGQNREPAVRGGQPAGDAAGLFFGG